VRVDSGVREGSEISVYYDPMISKLVTYGSDRTEALQLMRDALDRYVIRGVTHNINFLRSLCDHPRFIRGDLTTAFIPEEYPDGYKGAEMGEDDMRVLVGSAVLVRGRMVRDALSVGEGRKGWKVDDEWRERMQDWVVTLQDKTYTVHMLEASIADGQQTLRLRIAEEGRDDAVEAELSSKYEVGDVILVTSYNGSPFTLQISALRDSSPTLSLITRGTSFSLRTHSPLQHSLQQHMPIHVAPDTSKQVLSPMPGVMFSIKVKEGDSVVPGQEVCVVEAMKMQNSLRVSGAGKVKHVLVKQGQTVSADQVLIELE
jgi:propionyl-CoA carboxylase alpha chain